MRSTNLLTYVDADVKCLFHRTCFTEDRQYLGLFMTISVAMLSMLRSQTR